jgi:hypothetical protein
LYAVTNRSEKLRRIGVRCKQMTADNADNYDEYDKKECMWEAIINII